MSGALAAAAAPVGLPPSTPEYIARVADRLFSYFKKHHGRAPTKLEVEAYAKQFRAMGSRLSELADAMPEPKKKRTRAKSSAKR